MNAASDGSPARTGTSKTVQPTHRKPPVCSWAEQTRSEPPACPCHATTRTKTSPQLSRHATTPGVPSREPVSTFTPKCSLSPGGQVSGLPEPSMTATFGWGQEGVASPRPPGGLPRGRALPGGGDAAQLPAWWQGRRFGGSLLFMRKFGTMRACRNLGSHRKPIHLRDTRALKDCGSEHQHDSGQSNESRRARGHKYHRKPCEQY